MNPKILMLAITLLAVTSALVSNAEAQIIVSGARSSATQPVNEARCLRRERNPYFAARPVYPTNNNGARSNITFEPFTRWYYPNQNSYYPYVGTYPSIRTR